MTFLYILGRSMLAPVSPVYFQVAQVSILGIGILLGGFGLTFLVSEAAWGFLSARLWSKRTFLLLIVASGLTSIPMSRPQPFDVLLAIQVANGFCLGGMGVLPRLMVPNLSDSASKGKSFGFLGLVFAVGSMAGSLFGAYVYGAVGLSLIFIVAAAVSMLPVVPLLFVPFGASPGRVALPLPENGARARPLVPNLSRPEFIVMGLAGLTVASCSVFYSLLLPNILTRDVSFSASVLDVSLVIAIFSLSSGAFQPLVGLKGSRNPRVWIVTALAGCGLTFGLLLVSRNMVEIYLISFVAGISSSVITPLVLVILSVGVPAHKLGKVFGLYGAAENTGVILGSSVGGLLWATWGTTTVFLTMGGLFFASSAAYFFGTSVRSAASGEDFNTASEA